MTTLEQINEGTTNTYTAVLKDGALPITGLPFTGFRMSYYSVLTGGIVNGRDNQNILNANDVTIDGVGNFSWKLQEADVIIDDGDTVPPIVRYRAEFNGEWLDGAGSPRQVTHEIEIPIKRFVQRPFDA